MVYKYGHKKRRSIKEKMCWALVFMIVFFLGGIVSVVLIMGINKAYGLTEPDALTGNNKAATNQALVAVNSTTASASSRPVPFTVGNPTNIGSYSESTLYRQVTLTDTKSLMSVYKGPGNVIAHSDFEAWLGKPVPYAMDYLDYRGGWQKDFIDSNLWLMEPWGRWVKGAEGRKLVLGVPMLESSNNGQFSEGVRGDFDQYFVSLAKELVNQSLGSSIIRLGYEANCDTIGPWQATQDPNGYKALFRHEVAVLKSVPGSNFAIDWTVCNGLQAGNTLSSFESFYPGNDVVEIMGIDIYDVKWNDTTLTPEQRWDYIVGRTMGVNALLAFAKGNSKTVSYPEWGLYKPGDIFGGGGDDPSFIYKMTELINNSSPLYQSYFDYNWGGGILHDFSNSEVVFKRIYGK